MRDNAQYMDKRCEECGAASLGCMTHTLLLAVNKDVLSQTSISDCLPIGWKIVEYLKSLILYDFVSACYLF